MASQRVGSRRLAPGPALVRVPFGGLLPRMSAVRRESALAALNGLLGDHLDRLGHPWAIPMHLRHGQRRIDPACPEAAVGKARGHVLVLVHGLCQSDRSWRRDGHDPGAALQRALDLTAVHACFNSGLDVARNGDALGRLLEQALSNWPVPVQTVSIIGHGLGGLVARRAALSPAVAWSHRLRHLVYIGTPHLGLSLDRAGHWLHRVFDLVPPGAPHQRLSELRSAGIVDLQRGHACAPAEGDRRCDAHVHRSALPGGVLSCTMAGTSGSAMLRGSLTSDGLVPLASALGIGAEDRLGLSRDDACRWIGEGLHHAELMNHRRLLAPLRRWLQQ